VAGSAGARAGGPAEPGVGQGVQRQPPASLTPGNGGCPETSDRLTTWRCLPVAWPPSCQTSSSTSTTGPGLAWAAPSHDEHPVFPGNSWDL